jgi:hypothetical protein
MTAADWIAIGSLIVTGIATYLTYRTGKDAREDAPTLATETRDAQSADARRTRLFDARKALYVELLQYAFRSEDSVDRTEPMISWEGMPSPPVDPPEEDLRALNARTAAFGSANVLASLARLKEAMQKFDKAVFMLRSERGALMRPEEMAQYLNDLEDRRRDVKARIKELLAIANAELTS